MKLLIGSPNWHNVLINATQGLGVGFWEQFTAVSDDQLEKLENKIGRKLPDDFKEFYRVIGYGSFSPGDVFYSPDEIVECIGAPIYFVRGSLMSGNEWATEYQHQRLWLSRGDENPAPAKFTKKILSLDGVNLYDLLQIGINGSGCYHQLYVGPDPSPFTYCLLSDSGTIEDIALSFSKALARMIEYHLSNSSNKE